MKIFQAFEAIPLPSEEVIKNRKISKIKKLIEIRETELGQSPGFVYKVKSRVKGLSGGLEDDPELQRLYNQFYALEQDKLDSDGFDYWSGLTDDESNILTENCRFIALSLQKYTASVAKNENQ